MALSRVPDRERTPLPSAHREPEGRVMPSVTSILFNAARLSATGRAVRRGRAPQRVVNIGIGRVIGRLTRGLWR
jgi:hypothetical protein